jgi:hypothetical protein
VAFGNATFFSGKSVRTSAYKILKAQSEHSYSFYKHFTKE